MTDTPLQRSNKTLGAIPHATAAAKNTIQSINRASPLAKHGTLTYTIL